MRLHRRTTAFVSSLLLVQLSLVGGDASCASHDTGGMRDGAMPNGSHAAMVMDAGSTTVASSDRVPESSSHGGCATMPPSSGNCAMPLSCAAPSLPAAAVVALSDRPLEGRGWAEPPLARPAPLGAPELPPPRV